MADDNKNKDVAQEPEHHSELKGAAIGGAAGDFIAGKKGAVIGAAIGAEKQHKKNENENGK
jgi:outer membrane lipoprotein SlyB